MAERAWQIGRLAHAAGLSVRTLHYYDSVGLLTPSARTASGHRRYAAADVRRLYQVLALRQLGLGLKQIRTALDGPGAALEAVVSDHLRAVERQLAIHARLRNRLLLVLSALQRAEQPSTEVLIQVMNGMSMPERYLTREQVERLKAHHQALGQEAVTSALKERDTLIADLNAARQAGEDPASPRVQALRQRFADLHRRMIGGDEDLLRALEKMHESEGIEAASGGAIQAELHAYLGLPNASAGEAD